MGVPRTEAVNNLVARTEVPELRQFVHALNQAEMYGAPKVIFPLVFCILSAMFIVILGPAGINLVGGLG